MNIELIKLTNNFISERTKQVLYKNLLIKTNKPNLDDIVKYYDYLNQKTKQMKKTNNELNMLYNYLLKF